MPCRTTNAPETSPPPTTRNSEFRKARDEIAVFPEFWKPGGGGYRRKLLERFPYGNIYKVDGDEILIVALAHTSRHSEYWRCR